MKALIIIPVLALMFFLAPGETAQQSTGGVKTAILATITPQHDKYHENEGIAPTMTPYGFPVIFTPIPTATPDPWLFLSEGYSTYYSPNFGCWEPIISAHKSWGHLPPDFQPDPNCFYLASPNDELMGHRFKILSLANGREVIGTMVDAVQTWDKQSFYNRNVLVDVSYKLAQAIGLNAKVRVWVER